jgi:hypothetical protein
VVVVVLVVARSDGWEGGRGPTVVDGWKTVGGGGGGEGRHVTVGTLLRLKMATTKLFEKQTRLSDIQVTPANQWLVIGQIIRSVTNTKIWSLTNWNFEPPTFQSLIFYANHCITQTQI